jgi:protein-disulfide isomerase
VEQPIEKPVDTSNVHVPRATLNYFIIAIAFLVLGIVIGAVGYDRFVQANAQLVEASVTRALNTMIESQGGSANAETTALNPNERYDVPVANNPTRGSADAPVTIVEFSDFRCGFCGRFARETLQPLLASYDESEVQFVYRDFVIFGQQSYEAALAAECAHDQDKFWEFHDLIFGNQQGLSRDQYIAWAGDNGLDVDTFTTCYDSETHREEISTDLAYAQSLGLTGTPTFFINGRAVSGAQPIEVFRSIIDEELANAGPQVPTAG